MPLNSLSLAACVAVLWGLYPLAIKAAAGGIDVWAAMMVIGGLVAIIYLATTDGFMRLAATTPRKAAAIVSASLFGPILGSLLYVLAIQKAGDKVSLVVAVAFLAPLVTLAAGVLYFKEAITPTEVFGVILIVAGATFVVLGKRIKG